MWPRHRLFIVGGLIIVGATVLLLLFAREKRFSVGDVAINPGARIDEALTYELTLLEEELIVPWAAKTQSEMIVDGIRRFQERWPNVAVTYTILEADEARKELIASLTAGQPPDVYGTVRGGAVHPDLQVPASPYVTASAFAAGTEDIFDANPPPDDLWHPLAAAMLRRDDIVWGWPKALWWTTWLGAAGGDPSPGTTGAVGGAAALPGTVDDPWTVDDFRRWSREVHEGGGRAGAFHVLDGTFLEQWLHGTGAATDSEPLWSETRVTRAAKALRTLQQDGILPRGADAEAVARTRVAALLTDRVSLIGPVGPHLAQTLFRHRPSAFRLVPVPTADAASVGGTSGAAWDVGAYFVFRSDPYAGDDHTRVAAELAAFLAAHTERWLVESLALLPARVTAVPIWRGDAPLDGDDRRLLERTAATATPPPVLADGWDTAPISETVQPLWRSFWYDDWSAPQWAARVVEETDGAP